MPVDLGNISQQDRQDFESRLKVFGMDLSAVQEPLMVNASAKVTLGFGPKTISARQPFVVQTTDFAAVKRMVGIEDRVFKNVAPSVALPGRIELGSRLRAGSITSSGDSPQRRSFTAAPGHTMDDPEGASAVLEDADLASLDTEAIENIRLAARAFVRGNSATVSSFRPLIEATVGRVTIPVFALKTVVVENGSVLEFGPGVNALVAYEVQIEQGGVIRSRGHLTVSCTKLVRPGRSVIRGISATNLTAAFRPIFSE